MWLLVCNLGMCLDEKTDARKGKRANRPSGGIFALTICILASCWFLVKSRYSLLNYDRPFLKKIIGDDCFDVSEGVAADVYSIGLAGKLTPYLYYDPKSSLDMNQVIAG